MSRCRLVSVLEFDPFEHRVDRPSPEGSIGSSPDAWSAFWTDSLADAGVTGLTPLSGTWVVPVEDVRTPEVLDHVLRLHLCEPSLVAFFHTLAGPFDPASAMNAEGELLFDGVTPLRGGIALAAVDAHDAEAWITPECCGDLSNWREWLNATRANEDRWLQVWIGHPEARVQKRGDRLAVQKVLESGDPSGPEMFVEPAELVAATDRVREELRALERRLRRVVEPALGAAGITPEGVDVAPLAQRFAEHLAGLAEFALD